MALSESTAILFPKKKKGTFCISLFVEFWAFF